MRNLNVSTKLIISFATVIVLSVMVALAGIWGMNQIKTAADDIYYYNVAGTDSLGSIRENFALQRLATRELVMYEANSAEYKTARDELQYLESKMNEYISQYTLTVYDETDRELFRRFTDAYYNEYMPYKAEYVEYTDKNQTEEVKALIKANAGAIVNNIFEILEQSHELNISAAGEALKRNDSLSGTMRRTELSVLLITIIIVMILVFYLTHLIATPLKLMAQALTRMGTTGNMTLDEYMMRRAEEDSRRGDEIGMASRAIINLLKHIWYIEHTMAHISNGDFTYEVKMLSEQDTMGMSLNRVESNLNSMFGKIKEAEENALAASKAKSVFLAHMSHEIRTPLNAIMGMATIIGKSAGDREKTLLSAQKLMSSSRHLLGIVNDVLDMAKIESGKFDLNYEPFDLRMSLDDVVGVISQRSLEKQIHFVSSADTLQDYTLIGDKTRINQVLINLLGNAVKFTGDGGEVRFLIDLLDETDKTVLLKYTIIDNGIGISQEQISRLFQPFEQADSTTAARFGGTGLGLSISKNLVSMMGGTLHVESVPGSGSTFSFELLLNKSLEKESYGDEGVEGINFCNKRILLVEDVAINREIVCELLAETGLMIDEAENGQIAVDMFEKSPAEYYNLIFMDIQMPVMDGLEATRCIRALHREDAMQISIVAMTANAYKDDVERSLSAGMNGHLTKPVEFEAMIKALREHLGSQKEGADAQLSVGNDEKSRRNA